MHSVFLSSQEATSSVLWDEDYFIGILSLFMSLHLEHPLIDSYVLHLKGRVADFISTKRVSILKLMLLLIMYPSNIENSSPRYTYNQEYEV